MQLARYPRGTANARSYDAAPVHHREYADPAVPPPSPTPVGSDWVGWRAADEVGGTVGRVEGTIADEWLIIRDRRSHHLLAPVAEAVGGGEAVFLPYPHERIESAPQLAGGPGAVAPSLLAEARLHYGID